MIETQNIRPSRYEGIFNKSWETRNGHLMIQTHKTRVLKKIDNAIINAECKNPEMIFIVPKRQSRLDVNTKCRNLIPGKKILIKLSQETHNKRMTVYDVIEVK